MLAEDLAGKLTQPPFDASAMDGYAVRAADVARVAGDADRHRRGARPDSRFDGRVGPGQAVRIFTGAPVPEGADAIVIQEDTERLGDRVVVRDRQDRSRHVRRRGFDFRAGDGDAQRRHRLDAAAICARRRHGPRAAAGAPPAAGRHPLDRR